MLVNIYQSYSRSHSKIALSIEMIKRYDNGIISELVAGLITEYSTIAGIVMSLTEYGFIRNQSYQFCFIDIGLTIN